MRFRSILIVFFAFSVLLSSCAVPIKKDAMELYNETDTKLLASFEDGSSGWSGGTLDTKYATHGNKSLRLDKANKSEVFKMVQKQDWTGYDYLIIDLFNPSDEPVNIYSQVDDEGSTGYWTRVNIYSVTVPGANKIIFPIKQLYLGEKGRPGRMLMTDKITLFAFVNSDETGSFPLYIDNIRLAKDNSADNVKFNSLHAYSFGIKTAPVMDAFERVTKDDVYTPEKKFGWKDAKIWRDFNFLQPEPLYQSCVCPESGEFVVDVPNGTYRIFMNLDNPSGFWGEYQVYTERSVIIEGKKYTETVTPEEFKKKYYRFWNVEDSPADNTFDKYQIPYYKEKEFTAEVTDGQLNIGFIGEKFGISLSALVIYPEKDAAKGQAFLDFVKNKRRFYFDNYFKRVLHKPSGSVSNFTDAEKKKGYSLFTRDPMKDIYYNDMPEPSEKAEKFSTSAFAGEHGTLVLALHALKDLDTVALEVTDLKSEKAVISSKENIEVNYVSNRVTRGNIMGTVYSIKPRFVMEYSPAPLKAGLTKAFWLRIKTPKDSAPGTYKGEIKVSIGAATENIPVEFTVNKGTLDAADTPVGPFYFGMNTPLKDPEWGKMLNVKSIDKMKEYGMTTFSSTAYVKYDGFVDGKPVLDFTSIDEMMDAAKKSGFSMPIVLYGGGVRGFNAYYMDTKAMETAGFKDYSEFLKAVYTPIMKHAKEKAWLPVYFCLGDEPVDKNVEKSMENAAAYKKAFPGGEPAFTIFSSFKGANKEDGHYKLGKEFKCPSFNLHDEDSVKLIKAAGSDWSYYNSLSRWTFGIYLYKAVKEFDCKYRLAWNWNAAAGDPYYALDTREDDYAWVNSSPSGDLVIALTFERNVRSGIDDYRRLITLARLVNEKKGSPASEKGKKYIEELMASFKLGETKPEGVFNPEKWLAFRTEADNLINELR